MDTIFSSEEAVIRRATQLLDDGTFESSNDAEYYRELLSAYQSLVSQVRRMVRMSDLMESKLNEVSRKLDELSKVDPLTLLYNRRFFNEMYVREWNSSARNKTPLTVILVDIDRFKFYNDTYGHIEGDKCLQVVASVLPREVRRPRDFVARYGGEEFIVVLPETDSIGGMLIAETIKDDVAALKIENAGAPQYGIVTVSVGFASVVPHRNMRPDQLLGLADQAMYEAKQAGRNRVCQRSA